MNFVKKAKSLHEVWVKALDRKLVSFLGQVLETEAGIRTGVEGNTEDAQNWRFSSVWKCDARVNRLVTYVCSYWPGNRKTDRWSRLGKYSATNAAVMDRPFHFLDFEAGQGLLP